MEKLPELEARKERIIADLNKAVDEGLKALNGIGDPMVPMHVKTDLVDSYYVKLLTSNFVEMVLSEDDAIFFWDRCGEGDLQFKQVFARTVSVEIAWFVRISINREESDDPFIVDKFNNKRDLLVSYFVEKMGGVIGLCRAHMDFLRDTTGCNVELISELRGRMINTYTSFLDVKTLFESFCIEEEAYFCSNPDVQLMLFVHPRYLKLVNDLYLLDFEMRNYFLENGLIGEGGVEKYQSDIDNILEFLRSRFLLN